MKVTIKQELLNKLWHWTDNASGEISGMGRIIPTKDGYEIVHIYLLEQECTNASTDIDAQALSKLMFTSKDDSGILSLWWHTHANMGVFWSGTDTATIKDLSGNGMVLALVVNKKHEYLCRYAQNNCAPYAPFDIDKIEIEVEGSLEHKLALYKRQLEKEEKAFTPPPIWTEELNTKVKDKKYEISTFNKYENEYYGGFDRNPYYGHGYKEPAMVKRDLENMVFNVSKASKPDQDKCQAMYAWCFNCNAANIDELEDFYNMYFHDKELHADFDKEMENEKKKQEKQKQKQKISPKNKSYIGGKSGCKHYQICGCEKNCSKCTGFWKIKGER